MSNNQDWVDGTRRDLIWLRDKLGFHRDETTFRIACATLHRLLVGGGLAAAWGFDGQEGRLTIVAPSMKRIVETIAPERIIFAQAGGARLGGSEVSTTILLDGELSEQEQALIRRLEVDVYRQSFSFDEFTASACMVLEGQSIRRRVLLEFLADKQSGTPWDKRTTKSALQQKYEQAFTALEKIDSSSKIETANAIFHEVLSIAQSLNSTSDIQNWL
jgi:hypothetical protein